MCGIVGFTNNRRDIETALKVMGHRGPDDRGIFSDDKITLGHLRLSILDLSNKSHQPMVSSDGRIVLIYNGEIYNFKELKQYLAGRGCLFQTNGDTEVILQGYAKDGIDFFSKMRGMWALAIYDKNQQKLILSRDYFGIKPLYWAKTRGGICFASEMKAMNVLLPENVSPNTDYFFQYFNLGFFIAPQTCYKEVKKLEPGRTLIWDISKKELTELQNSLVDNFAPNHIESFEETVQDLDKHLIETVAAHFVSDVPIGLLLSGGNDSSLIAAMAKAAGFKPTAFNLNIGNNIDSVFARKVSKYLNLELMQEELSQEALRRQYQKVWEILDEPFGDISIIPTSLIFSAISGKTKVVLSGEGGDELAGGYLRNIFLAGKDAVKKDNYFIDICNAVSSGTNIFSLKFLNPAVSRFRNNILDNFSNDLIGSYLRGIKTIDYPLQYGKIREFFYKFYFSFAGPAKLVSKNLFFDRFLYLPNDLMYKGDISSMHYSIESRVPFLDKVLFNFAINRIKPEYCLSKRYQQKTLLKKVLEKYLPKDLVYRPKKGFSFSFKNYHFPEFRADVEESLRFHCKNAQVFGLENPGLFNPRNAEILIKKYDQFAFALVSNWKIFKHII